MGKSPGKWIKAKLFGKKSAKSALPKKGEAVIISKASSGVVAANDPVISNPIPVAIEIGNGLSFASGNQTFAKVPEESSALLSGSQEGGAISAGLTSVDKSNIVKQEQAAAKVQAVVRGFLARRAFCTLKGIIRLQALIRGHLVRRQAVSTLHSMRGIIRFQSLVRGQKIRLSDAGIEVKEKCNLEKLQLIMIGNLQPNRPVRLSKNLYAQKLLASLPNAMPLSIHYDMDDANSAWNWLERWSISHFWELVMEVKKDKESKSSRKSGFNEEVDLENGRPKRGIRRNSSAAHDNSSEHGKPSGVPKKCTGHQSEPAQGNGQSELEKVKRSLRKVSLTKTESNDKPEAVIEKTKSKIPKIHETASPMVPQQVLTRSVGKPSDPTDSLLNEKQTEPSNAILAENVNDASGIVTKEHEIVISPPQLVEEIIIAASDEPSAEVLNPPIQKDENHPVFDEVLPKKDSNGKENAKRRRSLSAKQEYPENVSHNMPALPSYMQATESAKAKLKAHGSPRLSQDAAENGIVRRHSLPSTGGKLNTPSPRIQKLVQGSAKGGIKSDKSLSASKDYNSNEKLAEWRR